MDKENVSHTHTHTHTHRGILFSHKNNEILAFAVKQMQLKVIMLPEISHTQKDKSRFSYVEAKKSNVLEYRIVTIRGWEE
jgi:hypothetical protein